MFSSPKRDNYSYIPSVINAYWKTTAILNDWDRAEELDALTDDHRLVIRLFRLFIIMRLFLFLDTGDVGVHFNRLTPTG